MQASQAGLATHVSPAPALLLSIERLQHRFANGRVIDLEVPMDLACGQAAVVTGPSGCGKTTLLRLLAGCPPEGGESVWTVAVLPAHTALAMQDPEAQLLCATVGEEIGFGVYHHGFAGVEAAKRIQEALDIVGLWSVRDRSVEALSVGEKYRLVLGAVFAMSPRLLLLDEPFSQLDAAGHLQLRVLIERQKSRGGAVIATAHEVPSGGAWWDAHLNLKSRASHVLRVPSWSVAGCPPKAIRSILSATGISYSNDDGEPILRDVCLELQQSSTVTIVGDNGSGKSTLLRCLAGILDHSGRIAVDGIPLNHRGALVGRIGYLPQNVDLLLFEETVQREVGFTLRRNRLTPVDRQARIAEVLSICGLTHLAEQPPLQLSHGERHLVAIASIIAARPAALLLDEPLTGLDPELSEGVLCLLEHCARGQCMAVLVASHARLPRAWGDRCLILRGGRLHAAE